MISKVFDDIVAKMCTSVNINGQWTSKLDKNVFVQKLNSHKNSVGAKCLCFHPFCYIVSGY